MTLRSRLIVGLLTIAVILVIPLLIAVQAMDRLHRDARALRDKEFAASLLLGRLREGLNDLRRNETALLFVHDGHTRDVMEKQLNLVAALIGFWLTRYIARPVRALEEGMEAVASGNLGYKLPLSRSRGDEFGRLSASFEEMTKQLIELDKLKAEFVSVASHELKTPIN